MDLTKWMLGILNVTTCLLVFKSDPMLRDRFAWMIADRLKSDWLICKKHRELNTLECWKMCSCCCIFVEVKEKRSSTATIEIQYPNTLLLRVSNPTHFWISRFETATKKHEKTHGTQQSLMGCTSIGLCLSSRHRKSVTTLFGLTSKSRHFVRLCDKSFNVSYEKDTAKHQLSWFMERMNSYIPKITGLCYLLFL